MLDSQIGVLSRFVGLLALCPAATALFADDGPLRLWEFRETHLAVPVDLRVYAAEEASANKASRAAYERIDELNGKFSDYDPDSEAMRLCREEEPVRVSPELFFLLKSSLILSNRT